MYKEVMFKKEFDGGIIAVFPNVVINENEEIKIYSSEGGYSESDYITIMQLEKALLNEYEPLLNELQANEPETNFKVIQRRNYIEYCKTRNQFNNKKTFAEN